MAEYIEKAPAVYIMASRKYGAIYIGVTSRLWDRVATHKDGGIDGFSKKYGTNNLVWYEHHHTMEHAILREKQLKKWNRICKLELISRFNPEWRDLHEAIDYDATLAPLKDK